MNVRGRQRVVREMVRLRVSERVCLESPGAQPRQVWA
jgi:hypothetical protein